MKSRLCFLATTELLLIFPASLFMASLLIRNLQPQQYEPAHTAQRIVDWYAARLHLGLWVLLIALPFSALVLGGATLLRDWRNDAQLREATRQALSGLRAYLATALIAAATVAACGILAIVALHMLSD